MEATSSGVDNLVSRHADWSAVLSTVERLEGALEQIRAASHGAAVSSTQGKVLELTKRENLVADGLIESFVEKWKNKCRECKTMKHGLKTTANDRSRLREKCTELEDHVTRLQKQFGQAIDLSVNEIQALSSCNNTFKDKIQKLEDSCRKADENSSRSVADNIGYLEKLKSKVSTDGSSHDDSAFGVIARDIEREIGSLQRVLSLNREYSVKDRSSAARGSAPTTSEKPDTTNTILSNELKEARTLIERQRQYIKELELSVEESSDFAVEGLLEDQREDSDLFFHLKQSILTQLSFEEEHDDDLCAALDTTQREIAAAKKLTEVLKQHVRHFKVTMSRTEDDACDMKEVIEELQMKLKSSAVTINSLTEENEFTRTRSEQCESRMVMIQNELQATQSRLRAQENEMSSLKEELRILREGKDDYKSHCTSLTSQQELMMEQINELQNEREKAWKAKSEESQRREKLKEENEKLNDELAGLQLASRKYEQEGEFYKRELERLQGENEETKLLGQETEHDKRKLKEQLRDMNISTKDLGDQIYQMSSENKKLEGEMNRLRKWKDHAERQHEEVSGESEDLRAIKEKLEAQLRSTRVNVAEELEQSQQIQDQLKESSAEVTRKGRELESVYETASRSLKELQKTLLCESKTESKYDNKRMERELREICNAADTLKRSSCSKEKLLSQIRMLFPSLNASKENDLDLLRSVTEAVDRNEAMEEQLSRLKTHSEKEAVLRQEDYCSLEQRLKENNLDLKKRKSSELSLRNKITFLRQNTKKNGTRFRRATQSLMQENTLLKETLTGRSEELDESRKEKLVDINRMVCEVKRNIGRTESTDEVNTNRSVGGWIEKAHEDLKAICDDAKKMQGNHADEINNQKRTLAETEKERDEYRFRVEDIKLVITSNEDKFKKLEQRIDTVTKFATNVNKKLEIIRGCVVCAVNCMMGRRESESEATRGNESRPEPDAQEDMLSVVRETYRANRQSFQAAVTVLESIKATNEIEYLSLDNGELNDGPGEDSEVGSVLKDMNTSINLLLKETRTFLSSPSLGRSPTALSKQSSCSDSVSSLHSTASTTQASLRDGQARRVKELEESVGVMEVEISRLTAKESSLEQQLAEKEAFTNRLMDEKSIQTCAVVQLEKDLELLRLECNHMSKSLAEKEATLTDMRDSILNEIVEQRKTKQDARKNKDESRVETGVDMERIKTRLDEIKTVNDNYSEKIEGLHEKVERFLTAFVETRRRSTNDIEDLSLDNAKKTRRRSTNDDAPRSRASSEPRAKNAERTKDDSAFESESVGESEGHLRTLLNSKEKENTYLQIVVKEMKSEIMNLQRDATSSQLATTHAERERTVFNPGTHNGTHQADMTCLDPYDQRSFYSDGPDATPLNYGHAAMLSDYAASEVGAMPNGYYPQYYAGPDLGYHAHGSNEHGCRVAYSMSESSVLPYSDDDCPYCETCDELPYYSEEDWGQSQVLPADCSSVHSREAKRISLIGDLTPMHLRSATPSSARSAADRSLGMTSPEDTDSESIARNKEVNRNEFPYNFGDRSSNPTSPQGSIQAHDCKKKKPRRTGSRRLSIPFPFISRKNKSK